MACQLLDPEIAFANIAELNSIIKFLQEDETEHCELGGGYKKNGYRKRGGAGDSDGHKERCKFIKFLNSLINFMKRGVKVAPDMERTVIQALLQIEEPREEAREEAREETLNEAKLKTLNDAELHTIFQVLMATVPVALSAIKEPINRDFYETITTQQL